MSSERVSVPCAKCSVRDAAPMTTTTGKTGSEQQTQQAQQTADKPAEEGEAQGHPPAEYEGLCSRCASHGRWDKGMVEILSMIDDEIASWSACDFAGVVLNDEEAEELRQEDKAAKQQGKKKLE